MKILCDTYDQFNQLEKIFNAEIPVYEAGFPGFFIQESDNTFSYCMDEGDCKYCDCYQNGSKKLCRNYPEIHYKFFMRRYKLERLIKNHQPNSFFLGH